MTGVGYKHVQFKLPTPLYEDFYRAFPEHGERTLVLRRFVVNLLEEKKGKPKSRFVKKLLEEVEEEKYE